MPLGQNRMGGIATALSGGPGEAPGFLVLFLLSSLALLVERADVFSRYAASTEVQHEGYQGVARPSSVELSS